MPGKAFNRVLLNKMKDSVDGQLRNQQAGFRKDRSCTDQIATPRIIVEQSIGWNSSLYINFIDYEKAFDSVDRKTPWKLLRQYGVPQNFYDELNCKIVHGGQFIDSFEVKIGVRQACTNPITIDGEHLENVKTFTHSGSIIDEHGGSNADVKAWIGKARAATEEHRELKATVNQHHGQDFQYKRQDSPTNKPDPSGGRNQEETLEVDRTHIEESTQLCHKTSPNMKSSRPKEKRKTKEHITPGNGDRHEGNEQELNGTRKEGLGQSGLKNAGRCPMLH
ncbi:unnamed protein product [Schistosoma curassoni]|uniref:Reverse transcriptase domain-containing protein n=1 Tax=Schistosoma curassoni TaxID=6186 RepID=A0A183JZP8_9TREM|nr:unnamed protein product [Schistosoma curassoni]